MFLSKRKLNLARYYLVSPYVDLIQNLLYVLLLPILFFMLAYLGNNENINLVMKFLNFEQIKFNDKYTLKNYITDTLITPWTNNKKEIILKPYIKLVGLQKIIRISHEHCENFNILKSSLKNTQNTTYFKKSDKTDKCLFITSDWDDLNKYETLKSINSTNYINNLGNKIVVYDELLFNPVNQSSINQVNNFLTQNSEYTISKIYYKYKL